MFKLRHRPTFSVTWKLALAAALAAALGGPLRCGTARARNVDLSTVPNRDSVELTIYNSEDLTLVRETRKVTFKKGVNPLQYSWANTLIDPSSVELKFLSHAAQLDLLDTTFPHDKRQMLYWNVQSEFDGEAVIQITYFTSGITWSADYIGIANKAETTLNFEGFVRVHNHSGEEYENAQVRLVVGTINLVEKIAQLAQITPAEVTTLAKGERDGLRLDAAKHAMSESAAGAGGPGSAPKQIVKEGLSEYFIFSIEGTETIPNDWSKRLRSLAAAAVPFRIQYRYRPTEYGDQLVRMYLLTNDEKSQLGTSPLPDGQVRLFRDNGRDGLSYLTEQHTKYIPIGDKIELNLGPDPEVVFEQIKLRSFRDNFWMQQNGTSVYKKLNEDGLVKHENFSVAGWDDHQIFTQRIRNYSAQPIDVEVRRSYDGHILFRSGFKPTLFDYRTVQFSATVAAGKRADLYYDVIRHEGYLAKQNNVTLEAGEAHP
ncbi:MAG TPA: hypothetical protein VFE24_16585 [Pirellulales bacterium]|jgi:hypothetical protein|nr:hypothetical protein [Pirellulales bacterium]